VLDEPGIGAFVVELPPPETWPESALLGADHIERLRATKRIIGERARAIFTRRTSMPPPQRGYGVVP
jgi:hypothetical protein